MDEQDGRAAVIAEALSWEGTRFADCQRLKIRYDENGLVTDRGGVDCMQFVYCVYHAVGLTPFMPHYKYSPQWFLHRTEEKALAEIMGRSHLVEAPKPSDVVVYKVGRAFAHAAIVLAQGWPNIIHAYKHSGKVERAVADLGEMARYKHNKLFFSVW
jgi:cell wall-associated NlpC family hydrolase